MENLNMPATASAADNDQVIVLLLADISQAARLWGWSRIVKGPQALDNVPGLLFSKVLGSGYEGGFGLRPSPSRQGLFGVFESLQTAQDFVTKSSLLQAYQERSNELCWALLKTWSCRGSWDGQSLDVCAAQPIKGPMAALTRASIKLGKAPAFWRHAPPAQDALADAKGCQLAVGLGEAPFVRQATFTLWDSGSDMNAYARSGAHLEAIQDAAENDYFSESMFARFVPLQVQGQWHGKVYA
jgi:heme-degrading monooxygenase HmoA